MATNFIQPGNCITVPADTDYASGEVVVIGDIIGIAAGDAATGEPMDVETGQVWSLPKVGAESFTVGAPVYYDGGNKLATSTSTDNTRIGVAVAGAAIGAASVKVRLSNF